MLAEVRKVQGKIQKTFDLAMEFEPEELEAEIIRMRKKKVCVLLRAIDHEV